MTEEAKVNFAELAVSHPVSQLKRIRDHHHQIARLVAEGRRTTDIAFEVGMSISRVSILKSDPAFQQLVEAYRANVEQIRDHVYAEAQKKQALLMHLTLDELIDRVSDIPEDFSNGDLLETHNQMADRLGYAKISKTVNATLNINTDTTNLAERAAAGLQRLDKRDLEKPGPDLSLPAGSVPAKDEHG
jgi:hypothetical protein